MKLKLILLCGFFLSFFALKSYSLPLEKSDDLYGLKFEVQSPFPDTTDDGVTMDTVRYYSVVKLKVLFENKTLTPFETFYVKANFPNQVSKYTKLIWTDRSPIQIDPDSTIGATWKFVNVPPGKKDSVNFQLRVVKVPRDSIFLTYVVSGYAEGNYVSELAYTNIYVPGGGHSTHYPDVKIVKTARQDTIYMGEIVDYKIRFMNERAKRVPAENVVVVDTLPSGFRFSDYTQNANLDFQIRKSAEGRTLLVWRRLAELYPGDEDFIEYQASADTVIEQNYLAINNAMIHTSSSELIYYNDSAADTVVVKPIFDLALVPQPVKNYEISLPDSQIYTLICKNNSKFDITFFSVRVQIRDNEDSDIFSISQINHDGFFWKSDSSVNWHINRLAPQDSLMLQFLISYDKVVKAKDYLITFNAMVDTVVKLHSENHKDYVTENNYDSWTVALYTVPDYKIYISADKNSIFAGDTVNFSITCQNVQVLAPQNPRCRAYINDLVPDSNLYTISFTDKIGNVNAQKNFIEWQLPPLDKNESTTIPFALIFKGLSAYGNYDISVKATIDSIDAAQKLADNIAQAHILLDGTPDINLTLGEINNRETTFPDSTLSFKIVASNTNCPLIRNQNLFLRIDENNDTYSLLPGSLQINATNDTVVWDMPALGYHESKEFEFQMKFDKIVRHDDYSYELVAETDFPPVFDDDSTNNKDSYHIFIDATPEMSIEIQEKNDKYNVEPDDTLTFSFLCKNSSFQTFDSVRVQAALAGEPIYEINNVSGEVVYGNPTYINWTIPPLMENEVDTVTFDLIFSKISEVKNYALNLTGAIFLKDYADDWAHDSKEKTITANANVDVLLGDLSYNPLEPQLNTVVELAIPIANNGNYPAKNAVLTIKKPDYAFLLYYLFGGKQYIFSDSTNSTVQIELGDLDPGYSKAYTIGVRIFSYKLLPDFIQNHLTLNFGATVSYQGGDDVSKNVVLDIFFNPAVADLFLDKNIVKPGDFPLGVTYKSSYFGNLDIKIYNLAGEFIRTVYSGSVDKGDSYTYHWKGDDEQGVPVASGVYFIYADSKGYHGFKKVIIIR